MTEKPKLKLTGVNGNAFVILGLAKRTAKRAGWTSEKIEEYMSQAMSGNYDHLLQTTMKYFDVS